jgi:hypothetical protein
MRPLTRALAMTLLLSVAACSPVATTGSSSPSTLASPSSPAQHRLAVSNSLIGTPDSQPLFLFQLPGDARLRGISWDGSLNGLLSNSGSFNIWADQSPDGRYVIIGGVIYDRRMTAIGPVPWPGKNASVTWSPDSTLMCKTEPSSPITGSALTLSVAKPGGKSRIVAQGFGIYGDNAVYPVLACDPARDRAVVGSFGQGVAPTQLWVIGISTGAIIRSIAPVGAWALASNDASLLAITSMAGAGATQKTIIERTDDGSILGTVDNFQAQGFSSDKSLLVGATRTRVVLLDWHTDRQIWSASSGPYGGYSAEPNGSHMAIGIGFMGGSDQADVYLVASDGSSVLLPEQIRCALHF